MGAEQNQPALVFLGAFETALGLLTSPDVATRWTQPSALAEMTVGALACHLGRQAERVVELVPVETDVHPLDSVEAHYRSAAWVTSSSPDDPANDRGLDDAQAALGAAALVDRAVTAHGAAARILDETDPGKAVLIPWQGWSLCRDDFLLTRMLEVVVHSHDLAASLRTTPPEFADDALVPVLQLLALLSSRRHGQSAVVGALSRSERSRPISAF